MILDYARTHALEPGTNRRGEQGDTTWLFLVPELNLEDATIVGSAPFGVLVALAALGMRLTVVRPSPSMRWRIRRLGVTPAVAAEVSVTNSAPEATARSVVYVAPHAAGRVARDPASLRWLRSLIAAGGAVYVGAGRQRRARAALIVAERLGIESCVALGRPGAKPDASPRARSAAWVIPASPPPPGPAAASILRLVRVARRLVLRLTKRPVATGSEKVSEPERSLGVERIAASLSQPPPGTGMLLRPARGRVDGALPDYVLSAAEAAGRSLAPTGWRMAPPRRYRAQNVTFFVRSADGADLVVKVTQDPRFNHMLENEAAALEALATVQLADALLVPELSFRSSHGELMIVGEELLRGQPFVRASRPGASPPEHVAAVTHGLTALGARTAARGDDASEALFELLGRYRRLYDPPADRIRLLEASVSCLGILGAKLPLVFMHGDATIYNVLLAEDRRAGLVDWEDAEQVGLPLWDLFHFLLTNSIWRTQGQGIRFTPRVFGRRFLDDAGGTSRASAAIGAYCRAVGVPGDAVEPLLLTWLASKAVREARQLSPGRLGRGTYHRFLVQALERSPARVVAGPHD